MKEKESSRLWCRRWLLKKAQAIFTPVLFLYSFGACGAVLEGKEKQLYVNIKKNDV